MDSWGGLVVVLTIVLVAALIIVPLVVIRQRYIKAFEALGWTFVNTPQISIVHGLNVPPFGLGEDRVVDEQVIGTTSNGTPFQAFEYSCSEVSVPGFAVTMPLPRSLPELQLVRQGLQPPQSLGTVVAQTPTHIVIALDRAYGEAAHRAIQAPLAGLIGLGMAGLTIDHDQVVVLGAPTEAAGLQPFVEAMAPLVAALSDPLFDAFPGPPRPTELGVYGRPDWVFRNQDDAILDTVNHNRGGSNHQAVNIIFCNTPPLPFVLLTHKWTTTRTSTDSQGRTTTHTDHHSEQIFEFHPTFPFGDFMVNAGWFGNRRTFESADFNEQFTIRSEDPRFASDLFHPRMMEFLMAARPGPFVYDGNGHLTIEFSGSTTTIESAHDFLLDFFSRVPNFVWENLGLETPPLPLHNSLEAGRPVTPPQPDQSYPDQSY